MVDINVTWYWWWRSWDSTPSDSWFPSWSSSASLPLPRSRPPNLFWKWHNGSICHNNNALIFQVKYHASKYTVVEINQPKVDIVQDFCHLRRFGKMECPNKKLRLLSPLSFSPYHTRTLYSIQAPEGYGFSMALVLMILGLILILQMVQIMRDHRLILQMLA